MATALTEVDAFTSTVVAPDDGDDLVAAAFGVPYQALANRTRWMLNRKTVAYFDINAADYSITSTGADQALNTIVVPMKAGETLMINTCAGLWGTAGSSVQAFAYVNVNGVRLIEQWASFMHNATHVTVDGISGGMLPFSLAAGYVATADGNVTVGHALGVTIGSGDTRHPSTLNILRVR